MLSNQTALETQLLALDTRVTNLQVDLSQLIVERSLLFQSNLENLPNAMATAVNEQNNRLWERLESHVQTQLNIFRPVLPTISVTGPQRQNTV